MFSTLNPLVRYLIAGMSVAILPLGGVLALSLGGNLWLYSRVSSAKARCGERQAVAVASAVEAERKHAQRADQQSNDIAAGTRQERATAVAAEQGSTDAREVQIRTVVVRGDCRMPDGLPSLSPAIDAANAAAR